MASCPECEFDEIDTEDLEEGDRLSCPYVKGLVMVGADELDVADDDDLDDDDVEEEEEDEDEDDLDEDEDEDEEEDEDE